MTTGTCTCAHECGIAFPIAAFPIPENYAYRFQSLIKKHIELE